MSAADLLPIVDPAQWAGTEIPPREWLLQEWIPARQATYLTGPGSAGKSLVAQQLATCSALGLPFMGVPTREARAIYLTCEDDTDELHRRQAAVCGALGVSLSDLSGRMFLAPLAGQIGNELATFCDKVENDEFGETTSLIRPTRQWHKLVETARAAEAGLIVLDNVAHLFAGNENIRNEVAAFIGLLNGLALAINGSVLLIGHPNKAGAEWSGSTAWENQVRSRLFLEVADPDIDPDARVLRTAKSNYSRTGATLTFRWHHGAFVRDEDLPPDVAQKLAASAAAGADNELFLRCLRERLKQRRAVSERHSPTYAPTEFAKMPEARGASKARLEAAMDRLFRIGGIERAELWKGPDRKPVFGLRETAGNGADDGAGDVRGTPSPIQAGNGAVNAGETHTVSYGYNGRGPAGDAAPEGERSTAGAPIAAGEAA